MIMKFYDTRAFDDAKCVINKMDPKYRWCMKSVDSCLLNVCHKNISDHRRDARSHWGPKNLPIQSVLERKYCKIKTQFQTNICSEEASRAD